MPETFAVIGKNYGDEGKGLAVSALTAQGGPALVVRHNGGAQAGHTVEGPWGRFVFHQLGSGSFHGADTLLSSTFLIDLYQLGREMRDYLTLGGAAPRVWADPAAQIAYPDDVLINMALETSRGEQRHGSCGMGIYEAQLRARAGYGLTVGEAAGMSADALARRLISMRREYSARRLADLGLTGGGAGEYGELLRDDTLLIGAAETYARESAHLTLRTPDGEWLAGYARVVFEGAQGLLLDAEYAPGGPHVTASRTGLTHPAAHCAAWGLPLDRAVYVTRSYVTRHGAGPLPFACAPESLGALTLDRTNVPNPWQGTLRYARHPDVPEFFAQLRADLRVCVRRPSVALLVTHLNETDGSICFHSGNAAPDCLMAGRDTPLDHVLVSYSPFEIKEL